MLRPRRDAATPRPNREQVPPRASCRAGAAPPTPTPPPDAPLVSFSPPFSHFYFYFGFFLSLHPCSHHHCSSLLPAGALHLLSLLPSLSSLPFSLQLEATPHPFIPAHPSAPSRCLALGKDRPYWRGQSPIPQGICRAVPSLGGPW